MSEKSAQPRHPESIPLNPGQPGKAPPRKLALRPYARAVGQVLKVSFKASPVAVIMKVLGSVISATLPLVTTYFAALTTTALAAGYAGDPDAGPRAVLYVVITAALGLFWGAFSSVDRYIQQLMSFKVGAIVGDLMYQRFLALEFWRYDDKETVDLYDRAKRFSDSYARVLDRIAAIFTQLVSVILAVGALLLVSWWIAVIVLVAIVPSVYLQFKLSREQIAHWNTQVDSRRQRRMIEQNLLRPQHIAEMRLYGIVGYLMELRSRLRDADERRRLDFQKRYIPKQLAADALQYGAEVVSLVWVVGQIIARAQPVGQFLYVQQIVSRALSTANNLVSSLSSIDEDLANLKDYELFMALPVPSGNEQPLEVSPTTVELRDIRFSYTGSDIEVIKGISMTIKAGQHIAIVGENGAGKSTLIRILAGLYRPDSGQVLLDGKDLAGIDVTSWHRHLAVLSQEFLKYEFATAAENIYLGDVDLPRDDLRIRKAASDAEAMEFIDKLPNGLENHVSNWMEDPRGRKGSGLSGGQWQRLAMARNFYRDASFMVMDEPTSAIDALAEHRIFTRLFADRNSTIIAISHRLATIEKADIVYMLEDGRIAEQGTHRELVALRGRYFRMFESQLSVDEASRESPEA
ncbi:ATP-binding cassette subfamily B protein/ATP-binding cassette subfamily C protein [Paenarthrobacter nicotinovorans]|jgi:ATP-binding cassette subfamily B protein/ATP-binding cassette subfamily C protein|uniref:ATP-binding cassette subfamily B protein/ATP-binding cassette subfamily C protein n=1 Tax=Paenarthrobacter nicotinovorans TaxID=29320 RepID=A0ABT9TH22_PAENI|nr:MULTISPECIES: ABC transporter ATP-binding protein [Paenarthrobacter]MBP2395853.1 ATP-binding cassette subfamily B protein/ATP-binding cassette subfamily C protein [Paenarthrobacter nicotinovorans]MDQ0100926.1 ATP-binding cassette subfamily B protein/ATP-binding cassette subfamily C protein [Paenarthrobacter nicotinovorans]QOT22539.1 ABC transporter ATP-binding protein [Paenarthrobacter sp. YJN-D]UKE98043.1 ABC transporter ATP-binding protein/permease [Paenarthrobacter nicotinovorans]UKF0283